MRKGRGECRGTRGHAAGLGKTPLRCIPLGSEAARMALDGRRRALIVPAHAAARLGDCASDGVCISHARTQVATTNAHLLARWQQYLHRKRASSDQLSA